MKSILIVSVLFYFYNTNNVFCQSKTGYPVPFNEIVIKCTQSSEGKYIITNQEEYLELTKNWSLHPDCANYELPVIDFSKNTLLGIVLDIGGCRHPSTKCFVEKENNIITFTFEIEQVGDCFALIRLMKWITIPKIDNNDSINFKIKGS